MRILMDQGGYELINMGDLAMLQIAVKRLLSLYPDASIHVFTSEPAKLTHYCPNTKPLTLNGRRLLRSRLVPRFRYGLRIDQRLSSWEDQLRTQFPGKVRSYLKFRVGLKGGRSEEAKNFEEYMEAIFGADVVVASGGGY